MKKVIFGLVAFVFSFSFSSFVVYAENNPATYYFSQSLNVGMENPDVRALQEFLISQSVRSAWPDGLKSTGFFGNATRKYLARYQASVGISPAGGYFGPKTRKYINAVLQGDTPITSLNEHSTFSQKSSSSTINIILPYSDSVLKTGENYTIKWNSQNLPIGAEKHISITLADESKGYYSIATDLSATGSYAWKIPETVNSGMYQIVVSCYLGEGIYCPNDNSDLFRIVNARPIGTPTITIISPKAGDVWESGKSYNIEWSTNNFPSFEEVNKFTGKKELRVPAINTITYTRPHNEALGIGGPSIFPESVPVLAGNQASWLIPKGYASGGYQIKINCPQGIVIYGCKDALSPIFQVVDPDQTVESLTIVSPNNGATWTPKENYNITWTSKNIPLNAFISAILTNAKTAYSITSVSNSGNANIAIPEDVPAGKYVLLFRTMLGGKYIDDRADFLITVPVVSSNTIHPAQLPELKITAPVSGTSWKIGTPQTVSWTRALEEIDYGQYKQCDGAYLAIIDPSNGSVAGYIDYLNTSNSFSAKSWWVGSVVSQICGEATAKILTAGNYKIRLSYIDPQTNVRLEIDSGIISIVN